MNKLFKPLAAAALVMGVSAVANASVSYSVTAGTHTMVAGATEIDFSSGIGYSSASGDYAIVSGDTANHNASPLGTDAPYLTVPDAVKSGSATFGLGMNSDYFGLYWGSVDSYNTLSFWLDGAMVASFKGSDIVMPANGGQEDPATNAYVNFMFTDGDMYDTVKFTSSRYAFESDNHAYMSGGVPEPQTLALMLLGMLGLGMARRRQRQA